MPNTTPPRLLGVDLQARWHARTPGLVQLAQGLETELSPLLRSVPLPIPERKARLTRAGGRCAVDGTPLTFDPWLPHDHRCPLCERVYHGIEHDDWWAMGAQLWCVERALQAALLGAMWARADLLTLAVTWLEACAERWPTYPNQDNALGPTRPFFSTYLESVWLLNGCLAAQMLRAYAPARATLDRFASRVVEPSRALIASFPEGTSNRQAWHTAAQLAAAAFLGDERTVPALTDGPLGVQSLITHGLLPDGSWYEGENYHLFAHRGLWYGVTLLEAAGIPLPSAFAARFDAGFRTPLLGMLPDGTFPARRDSRYATSVHQWRFAEWCELGLARREDPVLATWLHRLYHGEHPVRDTARARSTADIERDEPPAALTRADLGWRTLLFARPDPWPAPVTAPDASVVLPAQGLTVLRRDAGRLYVALEGGHTGGGHGHPDRLALTLQDGARRILEDPGTGSYVERTLHWYRSTLAHNAPLVDGRSQHPVPTHLLAFDARSGAGWVRAAADGLAPGVRMVRTVVLLDDHVVDHLAWTATRDVTVDLPVHMDDAVSMPWTASDPAGAGGLEDGFDFLDTVERAPLAARAPFRLSRLVDAAVQAHAVHAHYAMSRAGSVWRAAAPGPPRTAPRRLHWLRMRGTHGEFVGVWALRDGVRDIALPAGDALLPTGDALLPVTVQLRNGTTAVHGPAEHGWHVALAYHTARSSIDLSGIREPIEPDAPDPAPDPRPPVVDLRHGRVHTATLGAEHYRRSEDDWPAAGSPTAEVALTADHGHIHITVDARTGPVTVPEAGAENPLDNERADVNADGLQLYIGPPGRAVWTAAWLLVPDPVSGAVRVTPLMADTPLPAAHWTPTPTGWRMTVSLERSALGSDTIRFDLIVNERPPHRVRRRGQLILSGSHGEFVYLRGDRHDPRRAWLLHLPIAPTLTPS